MKKFTQENIKQFRLDFATSVKELEAKHGIKIDLGNIRFSETEFNSKVNVKITAVNEEGQIEAVNHEFERLVKQYGLTKKNSRGETLVDYKPRSWKRPWVYVGTDGKLYVTDHERVIRTFKA